MPTISPIGPSIGIVEGFEPQMLDYLSAGGSADGLRTALDGISMVDAAGMPWRARAQVIPADVLGNLTNDVVVALTLLSEGQYADGALFVFRCQDGHYEGGAVTALGGQVPEGGGPDPGIRAIQDMNRDGVPEIVLSSIETIGDYGNLTRLFRIIEWDGSQFVDLIQSASDPPYAAAVNNGDGEVRDSNGNRNLELILTNGVTLHNEEGGPQRKRTDIWAWDGYAFRLTRWAWEPATYRFQAIQDGDDATSFGRYDAALTFYQQAISDEHLLGWSQHQLWPDSAYGSSPTPVPDPDERLRLDAYAYYRMMLIYVFQDSQAEVKAVYDSLQERFSGDTPGQPYQPYVELAAALWKASRIRKDSGAICASVTQYVADHADRLLTPLGSGFYGSQNRDYKPEDLCPVERRGVPFTSDAAPAAGPPCCSVRRTNAAPLRIVIASGLRPLAMLFWKET